MISCACNDSGFTFPVRAEKRRKVSGSYFPEGIRMDVCATSCLLMNGHFLWQHSWDLDVLDFHFFCGLETIWRLGGRVPTQMEAVWYDTH